MAVTCRYRERGAVMHEYAVALATLGIALALVTFLIATPLEMRARSARESYSGELGMAPCSHTNVEYAETVQRFLGDAPPQSPYLRPSTTSSDNECL